MTTPPEPPEPSEPPVRSAPALSLPSVSVVIPVRDDAEVLDRCLRLLASQTLHPLEVVVVDNASSDDSAVVAHRHGARVVAQPLVGIPSASATGYDHARGDVIARLDADSTPTPDWVERIAHVMAAAPELDALTGSGWFYDIPLWKTPWVRPVYLGSYYLLVHAALGHTAVWGSNMALRRTTWQEVAHLVHREDPEIHDDMDLSFALGPLRAIRFDRRLKVGVSARSVRGHRQLRRRFDRAVRTLRVNWAVQPPWLRWQTRLRHRGLARS